MSEYLPIIIVAAIIGAFAGASGDMLTAATAGVASMGIAGELAYARSGAMGTGSFRVSIIDMLSKLDSATVREVARIEEV